MIEKLRPLPLAEWPEEARAQIGDTIRDASGNPHNVFSLLANYPRLMKWWLVLGKGLLRKGRLPARDRELVVLQTAKCCGCAYEWAHHRHLATAEEVVSGEEVDRILEAGVDSSWGPREQALLAAVQECLATGELSGRAASELGADYDGQQLLELLFLVGNYQMLSLVLRSSHVPLEASFSDLPQGRGD